MILAEVEAIFAVDCSMAMYSGAGGVSRGSDVAITEVYRG